MVSRGVLCVVAVLLLIAVVSIIYGLNVAKMEHAKVVKYEKLVEKYRTELVKLNSTIENLEEELRNATFRIHELESELSVKEQEIAVLRNNLNMLYGYINESYIENGLCTLTSVDMSKCFAYVVNRSISEIENYFPDVVVLLSRWEDPVEKLLAATRFIVDVSVYRNDPNVTIVTSSGLKSVNDVWKSFYETVLTGGDCEDLAIALGTLLKLLHVGKVYMVIYSNGTFGHAFLIAVVNGKVYLVDPANDTVNRYRIYLQFTMLKRNGTQYYVWLVPTDIPWRTFYWLYENDYVDVVLMSGSNVLCSLLDNVPKCAEIVKESAPYATRFAILNMIRNYVPNGYYMWYICDFQQLTCRQVQSPEAVAQYIVSKLINLQ